jgi:predicted PurR-regulated permease PerM
VVYNLIFAFIVSIYVLLDKNRLVRNLKRLTKALFPKEKASSLIETGGLTHHIFSRFIIGKTVDSLIIGGLCFILMSFFKMPFALIISLIVGITNMVPYVGPFIGAVPGFFIIFISSPVQSLFYLILILAIQQFDGLYLGPKILGDSTGLRPIWIIFAISVGGAAGGVLGMFLGVPCVAVIARLLDDWVEKRIQMRSQDE